MTQDARTARIMGAYAARDENVQVNGFVFLLDMSGFELKHLTQWSMDDMKKSNDSWQVSQQTFFSHSPHETVENIPRLTGKLHVENS